MRESVVREASVSFLYHSPCGAESEDGRGVGDREGRKGGVSDREGRRGARGEGGSEWEGGEPGGLAPAGRSRGRPERSGRADLLPLPQLRQIRRHHPFPLDHPEGGREEEVEGVSCRVIGVEKRRGGRGKVEGGG